jgi:hypothetical protein
MKENTTVSQLVLDHIERLVEDFCASAIVTFRVGELRGKPSRFFVNCPLAGDGSLWTIPSRRGRRIRRALSLVESTSIFLV